MSNEIEYQHAVVLSTAHIPRWLAEEWEEPIPKDVATAVHDRNGWSIPYGYLTLVYDAEAFEEAASCPGRPLAEELRVICAWVRGHCLPPVSRIIFDCDGPKMEGLPIYDWG
jgi:hypothetical protein